jgi:hypothetical protein
MLNTDTVYWKKNTIRMRVVNEIGNLIFQCKSVKVETNSDEYTLFIENNNNFYKITLSENYPFKIPIDLYINDIPYKKYLYITDIKIKEYLKLYYGLECLCCSSIMCANNWTPVHNISKILNDIDNTIRIYNEIILRIVCDEIKNKYKCYFLNIVEYLF